MTTSTDLEGTPPETDADNPDVRKSRLPDGRTISVRPESSGKNPRPTVQISPARGTKGELIKVRYNTHGQ